MTTGTKLSRDDLRHALREQDPAVTPPVEGASDPRARALFARIVEERTRRGGDDRRPPGADAFDAGNDGSRGNATRLDEPVWRIGRRLVLVGGLVTLVGVGSVLRPSVFGGSQALAWSATPQALPLSEAAQARSACDQHVRDDAHRPGGTDLSGLRPVIAEARGSLVMVYETDGRPAPSEVTCYVRDGRVVAAGGSFATEGSRPLPPLPADSLHGDLGSVFSTSSGSIRGVTGQVGSDVVGVELDTVARGPVTATVRGGHFAAWWPDVPADPGQENAATGPEITGATVTLRDGSTRRVTVEELSGHPAGELGASPTHGSATLQ